MFKTLRNAWKIADLRQKILFSAFIILLYRVGVAIPILVGLGLDELSMNAPAIPVAKQIIRQLDYDEVKKLARAVLNLESPADVKEMVFKTLPMIADLS